MINIVVPVACLLKTGLMDSMRVNAKCIWFLRETANLWKFPYENCHKQFSVAFLKTVKFVGEVLVFAINHDLQRTNAVIKIMLCFSYICLIYSLMLCTMYPYISVHVSTDNHKWNNDFFACGRPMGHLFLPLFICHFSLSSVNYFCSIYLIWDPCLYTYLCTYYGSLQYRLLLAHFFQAWCISDTSVHKARSVSCTAWSSCPLRAFGLTMHDTSCLNPIMTWIIWFWCITKPKFASEIPKWEVANNTL